MDFDMSSRVNFHYSIINITKKKNILTETTVSIIENTIPVENDFFEAIQIMLLRILILSTLKRQGFNEEVKDLPELDH